MNWPVVFQATIFGLLFFVYTAANAILVLGDMPDAFGWLKIIAGGTGAFVVGVFTFTRDPKNAWNVPPGIGKAMVLALLALGLTGCAMNADLVNALAKDPATVCVKVTTIYGTMTAARTNITTGDVTCDNLTVRSPGTTTVPVTVLPTSAAGPIPVTIK